MLVSCKSAPGPLSICVKAMVGDTRCWCYSWLKQRKKRIKRRRRRKMMPLNQAFDPLTVWNCHVSPRNSEWDLWLTHTTFGWWFVCLFLNQRKKLFGRKHVQVSRERWWLWTNRFDGGCTLARIFEYPYWINTKCTICSDWLVEWPSLFCGVFVLAALFSGCTLTTRF